MLTAGNVVGGGGRKRRFGRGGQAGRKSASALASRALAIAKQVRRDNRPEIKSVDINTVGSAINYDTTLIRLNPIAQGTDSLDRIGDQVKMHHLIFRGQLTYDASGGNTTHNTVRIMIIQDTAVQGVDPSSVEVLSRSGTVNAPLSEIPYDNKQRFKVLYSRTVALNAQNPGVLFKGYIRKNVICKYDGTAATDTQKNAIWMAVCSNIASVAVPYLHMCARFAYTDE